MNTKIAICTLTVFGLLSGCANTSSSSTSSEPRQVNADQLDRKRVVLFFEEGTDTPFSGQMVERYRGGELRKAANVVNGIPTGTVTEYFESGQKKMEAEIINGEPHGVVTEWFENGEKRREATFVDGRPTEEKEWYETGQLESHTTNVRSRDEVARTWDENGVETTVRPEIEEALNLAGGAKAAVSEFYMDQGEWPANNEMAGLNDGSRITGQYVTAVAVENGVISVSLGNSAAEDLSAHILVLTPTAERTSIIWTCSSPDIAPSALPEMCR